MFYKGFMLMTVTSFTELEVFSCLSFNILNEDLSGKVDKISSIIFKYTIHNWIRSYFSSRRILYTKQWLKWRHSQSFSWTKRHMCCKSHMWTNLHVRFTCVSKPLNWSAITTKYHRNNWTFFKIRYIYTKERNLTFKIV